MQARYGVCEEDTRQRARWAGRGRRAPSCSPQFGRNQQPCAGEVDVDCARLQWTPACLVTIIPASSTHTLPAPLSPQDDAFAAAHFLHARTLREAADLHRQLLRVLALQVGAFPCLSYAPCFLLRALCSMLYCTADGVSSRLLVLSLRVGISPVSHSSRPRV
jgi:hypothetical protein